MDKLQGYNPFQLALIDKGVEPQYISRREKGNKTYRYVEASYIVELLNKIFGYIWSWELVGDPVIKVTGGKDKNGQDKCFVTVKGRLTVPMLDPDGKLYNEYLWIKKESYGSHPFTGQDPEVQGYAYKAAATDALKKCASMLGVAKNVYMSEDMFAYLQEQGEADEWTDETIAMYKDQYDKMIDLYNNTPDLMEKIHTFCENTQDYSAMDTISPSNIVHFLTWLEEQKPSIEEELDKLEIESQPVPAAESAPKGGRRLY